MVGPLSSEERTEATTRLKIGFVLLVGFSAGLITLPSEPTFVEFGVAFLAGSALGVLLVWLVFPGTGDIAGDARRRR
ncbi:MULTISPECIES: hypothetical protein [unclassified Haladaptatus]|uniref:hypothetical protein n=1 Tax=unclassified Haladaptatus TaxID=2622732 RepID=UPI0023E84109|nr:MULTISPECIES: hypothetical protein [unclassified Haladaptatus]